jgi:predicted AAA+ superfamily ATPase
MDYIQRHIEEAVKKTGKLFAALLISGSRQVGKTWLLKNLYPKLPYVTLDAPGRLDEALNDPAGFFKKYKPPLVIDEIQYAPSLFRYIKLMADGVYTEGAYTDGQRRKGLVFMSGSQQYVLMKNVSETLAGRIGILDLYGLSRREIQGVNFKRPFLPAEAYLKAREKTLITQPYNDIWAAIVRGSLPELQDPQMPWDVFYSAYVRTYIERDVRQLSNVGDGLVFYKFMTAMAARSGQLLNYASVAEDIGVSIPTIDRWTSILQASNLIYLLEPYHTNILKRAVKTPKLYFLDTGLICYLCGWNTPQVLERGASAGPIFESYVISEIIKSYANTGRTPRLYFYRDKEQNEIDLLLYENGTLYPIEIKKHSNPRLDDIKAFKYIENLPGIVRGPGGVISLYEESLMLTKKDKAIPLGYV